MADAFRSIVRALAIALALTAPCAALLAQRGTVTRTKHGDTVVVTTKGNGVWGAPHDAIEVKRINGETKETTFGSVFTVVAMPDGGVLVVDTKSLDGLIVRQFDANGKFVRNLGGRGSGPGEYTRTNLSLAAQAGGSVLLRDSERAVNRYDANGKTTNSFGLFHTNGSTNEIVAATDGTMYLRAPFLAGPQITGGPGMQRPMLHYDTSGAIRDTVWPGPRWLPASDDLSGPTQWWAVLPDGRSLYTRTDKIGFLIADARGKAPPLIGEVSASPVPYLQEERDELQRYRDFFREQCPRAGPAASAPVPATKLAARNRVVDLDGRVWVQVSTTAQKIPPKISGSCFGPNGTKTVSVSYEEPPVYAAFQQDGTYLGEVRFPLRARVSFVGNTAWGIVFDSDDVPVLVKYQLHK